MSNFEFLAQQAPLRMLRLAGAGHITGDASEGTVLNVGQTYTVRAVPGAGEIFSGWSGSISAAQGRSSSSASWFQRSSGPGPAT